MNYLVSEVDEALMNYLVGLSAVDWALMMNYLVSTVNGD